MERILPSELSEGTKSANKIGYWLAISFCYFKPLNLCYFVAAALGN